MKKMIVWIFACLLTPCLLKAYREFKIKIINQHTKQKQIIYRGIDGAPVAEIEPGKSKIITLRKNRNIEDKNFDETWTMYQYPADMPDYS